MIVSLEALLGQIFLVTVVAVLVANIGSRRPATPGAAVVRIPPTDLAELTDPRATVGER